MANLPNPTPRMARCALCSGPIEHVPTPAGADPVLWPSYWRHRGEIPGQPHGARPVEQTGEQR